MMNSPMRAEQVLATGYVLENEAAEREISTLPGFTDEEIISLLWLRQWYQHGGSDRVEIVRCLEYLKQQVLQDQRDH